ncbi:ScbR family autoregulator-binding transcription factor [Streptomyces sp. NPDC004284]|uniref:ScbR family autoregulator-binding transcription factor n=1 Tax=Streptomyces sp. NPDC004284 TaxID=3364695 RepID=UPI0036A4CED3
MSRPQQSRAVRTRAAIVRSAAEEFDLHGYAGTSTTKIVKRAGSTMGALYFHFDSKEDLARAVMAEQGADLPDMPGSPGLQRLIDLTFEIARALQDNVLLRAGVRLAIEQGTFGLRDESAYQLWIATFEQELVAAQALGELRDGVDPAAVARFLVGSYSGIQLLSDISSGRADLPERITELWRYVLPALAVPELLEKLRQTGREAAAGTGAG